MRPGQPWLPAAVRAGAGKGVAVVPAARWLRVGWSVAAAGVLRLLLAGHRWEKLAAGSPGRAQGGVARGPASGKSHLAACACLLVRAAPACTRAPAAVCSPLVRVSLRLPGECRLLKLSFSLLFAGVFNHAVPSASAHPFGASFGSGAACRSGTLSLTPLQAVASTPASSFQAPPSMEPRPPPPPPPAPLGQPPAGSPTLHAPPPPNATLPPAPALHPANSEPVLLQNLAPLSANQAFLPVSSAASLPPANSALSIKLASLPHKVSHPSFTVHHQPLPGLALAQAAPELPQASSTGPSAVWVSLGMPPPYAARLAGVKPR